MDYVEQDPVLEQCDTAMEWRHYRAIQRRIARLERRTVILWYAEQILIRDGGLAFLVAILIVSVVAWLS
jgi:hypothetical protein